MAGMMDHFKATQALMDPSDIGLAFLEQHSVAAMQAQAGACLELDQDLVKAG